MKQRDKRSVIGGRQHRAEVGDCCWSNSKRDDNWLSIKEVRFNFGSTVEGDCVGSDGTADPVAAGEEIMTDLYVHSQVQVT